MNKICYIAGAGDFIDACLPLQGDYVIAADGGYKALIARGVKPDIVMGDFDSLGKIPDRENIEVHPIEKDETDMAIAVSYGFSIGCNAFILNGGCGGRIDHTLANIQLLISIAKRGGKGYLPGNGFVITAVSNAEIRFPKGARGIVSVFCMDGIAFGVTERGFKYELTNAALYSDNALGVSNEILSDDAFISVHNGCLVIVCTQDAREMLKIN